MSNLLRHNSGLTCEENYDSRSLEAESDCPRVSVVILNWNGIKDTIECIEALGKINYPNYDIVVVDNGSSGNDVEILKQKYGDKICIIANDRNYGLSKGRNIGIRYALTNKAEYIQILDNDVIVAPDFLVKMIDVAQSDPNIGAVGPMICYYEKPDEIAYAGRYIDYWTGFIRTRGKGEIDRGQFNITEDVDCATGGTMLISRKALVAVGLLDERFFFWFEDMEFCARLIKFRFRVVLVPHAKVWVKKIKKERTSGNIETKEKMSISGYYFIRNRFIFMKKHCSAPQFITSSLCFAFSEFPRLSIKFILHYRSLTIVKSSLKGIWDILFGRHLDD